MKNDKLDKINSRLDALELVVHDLQKKVTAAAMSSGCLNAVVGVMFDNSARHSRMLGRALHQAREILEKEYGNGNKRRSSRKDG